jgi:hypothetical protein
LAGSIAGDAEFGFRLRSDCWMRDQVCKDGLMGWWNGCLVMIHCNGCRTMRAFLHRGTKLRITTGKPGATRHAHHAMMLPIAKAAGREIRSARATQSEERLDEGRAEDGQQRDGKDSPQHCH